MKTPKRKHYDIYKYLKCQGWDITYTAEDTTNALHQCTLCGSQFHMAGLPKRTRAIHAKWMRWNRESRLKHKIAALANDLQYSKERERVWRRRWAQASCELKQFIETSCHGQDIEGN